MSYTKPAPKPIPFDQIDWKSIDLGDRFIHRIDKFGCYYVQLRVRSEDKMHYGPAKTFYDNRYGETKEEGIKNAYTAAVNFRDEHVLDFFRKVNYDPTLRDRQKAHAAAERNRPKKFKIRKESKSGLMSDIRYVRLLKRNGSAVRCVLEVTVNVHGKHFTSRAYSYSFQKYGSKAEAIKTAKKDRDRLAELVHKKAALLNRQAPMSKQETRDEVKSIRIDQTKPQKQFDPSKYIRRSFDNTFWIVHIRKQINNFDFRPVNERFYDSDYQDKKHKSHIAARRYALNTLAALETAVDRIKKGNIIDHGEIQEMFEAIIEENKQDKATFMKVSNGQQQKRFNGKSKNVPEAEALVDEV